MGSLRALFALAVVFAHSPWHGGSYFVGGQNAVQLFYVTSGFVISHVLLNVPAYRDVGTFYASRALRLYPLYYAVLGMALAWLVLAQPGFFDVYARMPEAARLLVGLANLTLFGQDWVLFMGVEGGQLAFARDFRASPVQLWQGLAVPQAWTLGIELAFYLVAPFVVRRRRVLVGLLAASIAARVAAVQAGWGGADPWTYRFFPFELALFLAGMLSHQVLLPAWKRAGGSAPWLPAAGTAVLLAACALYPKLPGAEPAKTLLLFAGYVALMPLAFLFQQRSRVDDAAGDLSYPLYIGHYLVLWVCARAFAEGAVASETLRAAVYVAASIAFAIALHLLVVKPVERRRAALRRRDQSLPAQTALTS